jgi:hypothetical protein
LAIFIGATAISGQEGPGPEAAIGWPNRFLVIAYCIWRLPFRGKPLGCAGRPSSIAAVPASSAARRRNANKLTCTWVGRHLSRPQATFRGLHTDLQ